MPMSFIHKDFLLETETAKKLYHDIAAGLPIIDYHNHLSPHHIRQDINFDNITQAWLFGDHYKWRAMRTCGVDETLITGDATDKEKFLAWAETVPKTIKNPLFHWTHMELEQFFGIREMLNSSSAESIWERCNEMLRHQEFSTRSLLTKNKVDVVATTDDPIDSLVDHNMFQEEENTDFCMVPTFRPDNGMKIEGGSNFKDWVAKLEKRSDISVTNFNTLLDALQARHDFFHELGCRASDHGIDRPYSQSFSDQQLKRILDKALTAKSLDKDEISVFKSAFLYYCGIMDSEKNWVYQLHVGAIRNNNTRMMKKLGPDSGFDSMGDVEMAKPLARLLDRLDTKNQLPKTVLYNLNPRDNELFATMIGNFQDGTVPGKLQHGPPWWFLDQKDGIEKQIESLSNMGVLYEFIGMTTDSRSFLSFSRHQYFRRIFCNVLGNDVNKGVIPNDMNLLGDLVKNICYQNVKRYFNYQK